ncbi:MAG: hypothetical protein IJA35_07250 [Clostridia bacterium]|nr:hypothetical protein [Clostridia bacterium]
MKKVTLWFTLFALIVSITPVFTNATHRDDAQIIANRFDCPTTIEAEELIYSLYDAINEQNLNSLPGMFEPALQNEYAEFISNEENRKEHLGLFNIKTLTYVHCRLWMYQMHVIIILNPSFLHIRQSSI